MERPARRPSMADVAARANVSYQTVSRVLNEPDIVRPATRERVVEAISALGYTRNRAARALKTTRSSLIGVMTDGSPLFGPSQTTTAIEAAARQAGYGMLLTTVSADAADRELGAELLSSDVDGILVVAAHEAMLPVVESASRSTPVIAIASDSLQVPGVEVVGVDQDLGAGLVMEHLVRTEVRRITHLAGPEDWLDARARARGVERSIAALGVDGEILRGGTWDPRSGYEQTLGLIRKGLPEAIFAANDMMAIGAMAALNEHGVQVPEVVSVVGFDDTQGAEFLTPSLTTVSQPFTDLGRLAVQRLLDQLDGTGTPADSLIAVPPRLMVRGSTRPEPAS